MRVAIHQTSPIAGRCAEVLLADRSVDMLGVLDAKRTGPKITTVEDLGDWDLLVSDAADAGPLVTRATQAGIPLVIRGPVGPPITIPVLTEVSLETIARALAASNDHRLVASTIRGERRRTGTRVRFPPPVGTLSATEGPDGMLLAPTPGDWGGAIVDMATGTIGITDNFDFLEAIALASGALLVAAIHHEPGLIDIRHHAGMYLDIADAAGLEIARFRPGR